MTDFTCPSCGHDTFRHQLLDVVKIDEASYFKRCQSIHTEAYWCARCDERWHPPWMEKEASA